MRVLLFLLLFLLPEILHAQETRKYWIFFTDKQGSEVTITPHPAAQRRRILRGSAIDPDVDRPVSPLYLQRLENLGITPVTQSRWLNAISARLTPDQVRQVQALPFVRRLQPVSRFVQHPIPSEAPPPAKTYQEPYGPSEFQLAFINAIPPLERGFQGSGVRIGFLDTAFQLDHPALIHLSESGRLIATYDFVYDRPDVSEGHPHGTMTSSTALGYAENELIGPGYQAEFLAAHTEYAPTETNQEEDWFVAGMEWMEQMGADIVNVSLGYSVFDEGQRSYTYADMDGDTAIPTIAADRAAGLGIVVVVSAGNEGGCGDPQRCWYYITSPADGDSVITVGAARPDSTLASFSSRGPTADGRIKPDVTALGVNVYVAYPPDRYVYASGTSFSAPLTTGVVAQLLQANPSLNPIEVRDILRATAHQATHPDNEMGWGIINADAALATVLEQLVPDTEKPGIILQGVYPNPATHTAILEVFTPEATTDARLRVFNTLGQQVQEQESLRLYPGVNRLRLSVMDWPAGVYFLHLEGTGSHARGKMVVLHR